MIEAFPWETAPHYLIRDRDRIFGSIRREFLNHVIMLNERHLCRILKEYVDYYNGSRTHLSLNKDSPESRIVEPPNKANIIAFPKVGGLHHHYSRQEEFDNVLGILIG